MGLDEKCQVRTHPINHRLKCAGNVPVPPKKKEKKHTDDDFIRLQNELQNVIQVANLVL